MSDDSDPFGSYGLARVHLEHRSVFETFFSSCRTRLSDYSFASAFIWRDASSLRWRILHDCLCLFAASSEGMTLLLPPAGEGDTRRAADEALSLCADWSGQHRLGFTPRIDYVSAELLDRLGPGISAHPTSGDYIYPTRRMIELDGGDLASKRQARNRFLRRYDVRVETLEPGHVEMCAALLEKWRAQSDDGVAGDELTCFKRLKESQATLQALRHGSALGLEGMCLWADGQLVGFTLGERLGADMCSILIEKADRQFVGSAQFIFSEFCARHWQRTTWTNAGDDWEIPSLAWTKQSYRPAMRLEKFSVELPVRAAVTMGSAPAFVGQDDHRGQLAAADVLPMVPAAVEVAAGQTLDCGEAALGDLDRLYAIELACFAKPAAVSKRQLRYLIRSPHASVHVLRAGDQIVAEALLLRRRTRSGISGRLYSLAVDPAHRGKGLGRALLRTCIDVLAGQGIRDVYLEVDVDNAAAIALYESEGFRRTRRLVDYYAPGRDGWKMHAVLSPRLEAPRPPRPDNTWANSA
jgi:ribosomal protein S18 acetylase RimI-like enzyme